MPRVKLELLLLLLSTSAMAPAHQLKSIVVTGGNKGVGRAIVERLLSEFDDTYVYLGARDTGRGLRACDEIKAKLPKVADRLEFVEIDVSDDTSVKRAADSVAVNCPSLYALMNNAGIGFGRSFSETLNTNFYGVKRVCEAFLPLLKKQSDPCGRLVNMASASGPNFVSRCNIPEHRAVLANPSSSSIDEILGIALSYERMTDYENSAYGLSKACLNAYTYLLARENPDILINSCTPGYLLTDLTRGMGKWLATLFFLRQSTHAQVQRRVQQKALMRPCIFSCRTKSRHCRLVDTMDQMLSEVQLIAIENPVHPLTTAHRRMCIGRSI